MKNLRKPWFKIGCFLFAVLAIFSCRPDLNEDIERLEGMVEQYQNTEQIIEILNGVGNENLVNQTWSHTVEKGRITQSTKISTLLDPCVNQCMDNETTSIQVFKHQHDRDGYLYKSASKSEEYQWNWENGKVISLKMTKLKNGDHYIYQIESNRVVQKDFIKDKKLINRTSYSYNNKNLLTSSVTYNLNNSSEQALYEYDSNDNISRYELYKNGKLTTRKLISYTAEHEIKKYIAETNINNPEKRTKQHTEISTIGDTTIYDNTRYVIDSRSGSSYTKECSKLFKVNKSNQIFYDNCINYSNNLATKKVEHQNYYDENNFLTRRVAYEYKAVSGKMVKAYVELKNYEIDNKKTKSIETIVENYKLGSLELKTKSKTDYEYFDEVRLYYYFLDNKANLILKESEVYKPFSKITKHNYSYNKYDDKFIETGVVVTENKANKARHILVTSEKYYENNVLMKNIKYLSHYGTPPYGPELKRVKQCGKDTCSEEYYLTKQNSDEAYTEESYWEKSDYIKI